MTDKCVCERFVEELPLPFDSRELQFYLECNGKTINDFKKWAERK